MDDNFMVPNFFLLNYSLPDYIFWWKKRVSKVN